MSFPGCSRALIVSVSSFYPGLGLSPRPGTKHDTKRLHSTLCKHGFSTRILNDPDAEEIYQAFHSGNTRTHTIIYSHGVGLNSCATSLIKVMAAEVCVCLKSSCTALVITGPVMYGECSPVGGNWGSLSCTKRL